MLIDLVNLTLYPRSSSSLKAEDAPEDMVVAHDSPITRDAPIWSLSQPTLWIANGEQA